MIAELLLGSSSASKCRTIDKVDIFGDGSGVALYQLDGNANDTGGNYHGTETAITYGGGVYERCAIGTASGSKIATTYTLPTTCTITGLIKFNNSGIACLFGSGTSNTDALTFFKDESNYIQIHNTGGYRGTMSGSVALGNTSWYFFVASLVANAPTIKIYSADGTFTLLGQSTDIARAISNVNNTLLWTNTTPTQNLSSIDQVRIFNRAITATEVATLYAECAPTSTVDNINPFEDGSLKALYQFNGDATDKTGVYNGTATNVTYGTGKFGQCAVSTANNGNIATTQTLPTVHTVAIWFKIDNVSGNKGIYTTGTAAGNRELLYVGGNSIQIQISGSWATAAIGGLVAGKWYLAFASMISTTSYKLRLYDESGTFIGQGVGTGIAVGSLANFTIGSGTANSDTPSLGVSYDQTKVFNKLLTPMEEACTLLETTPLEEPMYKLVDPFKDFSGVALFRFGGNALDESGNYNGVATAVTYGVGEFGRCFIGNGSAKIVATGAAMPLSISVSCRVKAVSFSTAGVALLSGNNGSWVSGAWSLQTSATHITLQTLNGAFNIITLAELATNAWNHFSFSIDNVTSTWKFYLNDVLKATITTAGNITANTKFEIGSQLGAQIITACNIAQVRVIGKVISTAENTKLYTGENNVL